MNEGYIECVLVDICKRRFVCVSDQDETKPLVCDTMDEFMRVLEMCQTFLPEDSILWVDPLTVESGSTK